MSTGHDEGVFLFKQANFTQLLFFIFVFTYSHVGLSGSFLFTQAKDGFDLKGHAIDQHNLLGYIDTLDLIVRVHFEYSIVDYRILLALIGVVNAHYNGVVLPNVLG